MPHTFPTRRSSDVQNVHFREGVLFGYRWYDAKNIAPAFPFGFGLSYTTFGYSDLDVSPSGASVTVRNTGTRAGAAVVQLYVGMPQIGRASGGERVGQYG